MQYVIREQLILSTICKYHYCSLPTDRVYPGDTNPVSAVFLYRVSSICKIQLQLFPFDVQRCMMVSYSFRMIAVMRIIDDIN